MHIVKEEWFADVLNSSIAENKSVMCVTHATFPENAINYVDSVWNSAMAPYHDATRTPIAAAECVRDYMNGGGEFIGWFMGHSHSDELQKLSEAYGNQAVFVVGSPKNGSLQSTPLSTNPDDYSYDNFEYVSVDTKAKLVKILKIGADTDYFGVRHRTLVWNYSEGKVISEN